MLKFQKDWPEVFEFLRPLENVTPDAGQNPGATKIPLPLQAGIKKDYSVKITPKKVLHFSVFVFDKIISSFFPLELTFKMTLSHLINNINRRVVKNTMEKRYYKCS